MVNLINITNENGNLAVNYQYVNPIGTIVCFAGQNAPDGWILCDGSEISKEIYSELYSIIGNNFGTPINSNNFVLPNLQQRMPLGRSNLNNVGDIGGNSNITLTTNQLPSHSHTGNTSSNGTHTHTANDSGHTHPYDDAYFAENTGSGPRNVYGTSASTDYDNNYIYRPGAITSSSQANISVSSDGLHSHSFTTDSTGSNSSINIMNPYLVLNYLIKY